MAKIYHVKRVDEGSIGWDEYIEFAVVEDSPTEAMKYWPDGRGKLKEGETFGEAYTVWPVTPTIMDLSVREVGTANPDLPIGTIIISSFNAG